MWLKAPFYFYFNLVAMFGGSAQCSTSWAGKTRPYSTLA